MLPVVRSKCKRIEELHEYIALTMVDITRNIDQATVQNVFTKEVRNYIRPVGVYLKRQETMATESEICPLVSGETLMIM